MKYRFGQGMRALLAPISPVEQALARRYLTTREYMAFQAISRAEQLHSLDVLRAILQQQADTHRTLAAAALLHDIGKSRYRLAVWQKTLAVLLTAASPSLAKRLGQVESFNAISAPFAVAVHHAKWGGEILRGSGSDADVIWLVEHHQDALEQWRDHACFELLQRLQAADQVC